MARNKKIKDRHLDTPSEANRDKHINFLAIESGETDQPDTDTDGALSPHKNQKKKSSKKNDTNDSGDEGNITVGTAGHIEVNPGKTE